MAEEVEEGGGGGEERGWRREKERVAMDREVNE